MSSERSPIRSTQYRASCRCPACLMAARVGSNNGSSSGVESSSTNSFRSVSIRLISARSISTAPDRAYRIVDPDRCSKRPLWSSRRSSMISSAKVSEVLCSCAMFDPSYLGERTLP